MRQVCKLLLDRNLLVVQIGPEKSTLLTGRVSDLPDTEAFRERFTLPSEHFEVVLVGKDGRVKKRWPDAFDPEDMNALIDSMPMRQDEMQTDRQ